MLGLRSCGGAFEKPSVSLWVLQSPASSAFNRGNGRGFPPLILFVYVKQGGEEMDVETAVNVYVNMLNYCLPVALVFGLGNMCVKTLLRVAFGGKLSFDA